MEKEAKFMASIKEYIKEHGVGDFYEAKPPKSKTKFFHMSLPKVKEVNLEEFQEDVLKSVKKHRSLYDRFKSIEHVDWLIHRYDTLGYLNNISLSVSPKIKEEWGITHELFGAFYNVDMSHSYCSLFSDLEPNSSGNVFFFKPKKGMTILANPPYTADWIRWTCKKAIEWKGKYRVYVVIPVWDKATRKAHGLKEYADIPEIGELIAASDAAEVVHLPFYDGVHNKNARLKDPVHVIVV